MRTRSLLVLVVLGGVLSLALPIAPGAAQEVIDPRPNVLIIVTDDQRAGGTMGVMDQTTDYFTDGSYFPNAIATTPVCCPSRASIMTGRYAHNHNVRSNASTEAERLDQETTLQYYLQQEGGYRTGLFGKYLNGWDIGQAPPYFDEYAVTRTGYYNARFGIGRDGIHSVERIPAYSTRFVGDSAMDFIERAETNDAQPWALLVTPFAPHAPAISPPRYSDLEVNRFRPNPAMHEEDLSDKPPLYLTYSEPFVRQEHARRRRQQLRTLMAVDDMVRRIRETLTRAEESNTLVLFMSDNGFMWGEHGLIAKATPYEQSLRIPLFMRWEGHELPATDERLVANIDIAPTVYEVAQVTPDNEVDGRSLLQWWERESLLAEVYGAISRPELRWAGVIGRDYQYVEYYGEDDTIPTFREYYDMLTDPWQLQNLYADGDPNNDPDVPELSARLAAYRSCPTLESCP